MEPFHDYDTSWTSSTNWSVAAGSLLSAVSFESSLAPIADDPAASAADSAPKSPLILCPASPDSAPCEITIAFAHKHEVRQVYLRSTARVYEIYYAPKPQSDNEYLCTVRCGIASRDDEVLRAANLDEAALANLKGSNRVLDESRRPKSDSSSNSNEDDWVEVKAPDTLSLDGGSGVPSNFSVNSDSTQDLYEATAEINDATPCMSITLRLLSLQNKGCVCVDELYVFADPAEAADSDNEVGQVGNAAGSSLMAMLAPTLLQLSKTSALRHMQNKDIFDSKEKEKTQDNGSKVIGPLDSAKEILQNGKHSSVEEKSKVAIAATVEPNRHETPPQVKDREAEGNASSGHIESFLGQLVSRVSRVEDLLLKFEESMLKPISSIDARLQRVEQQLEELTKKPKISELASCTRFSAPEFSCHDSDNYTPCHDLYGSREKDISSSIQHDGIIYSVNAGKSFPSLVVTAPEFSNADDEEDDNVSGTDSPRDKANKNEDDLSSGNDFPKDEPKQAEDHASGTSSPKDKPKQTVSIDDALASALASFLSSTSNEPQKYTQALTVKAPDFSNEEDGCSDKKVPPKLHFRVTAEPFTVDMNDVMDSTTASVSPNCYSERIREAPHCLNDEDSEQKSEDVDNCHGQSTCNDTVDCVVTTVGHDLHQIAEDTGNGEVNSVTSKILALDEADILNEFLGNHVNEGFDTDEEGVLTKIEAETTKQGPNEKCLHNVLELSYPSSVVDFETPILDVKFTPLDNTSDKSSLEALLFDMPVADNGASCSKKSVDDSQAGEECVLISIGNGEPALPETYGHFSVELEEPASGETYGHFSVELEEPALHETYGHISAELEGYGLNSDAENMENHLAHSNQGLLTASLI